MPRARTRSKAEARSRSGPAAPDLYGDDDAYLARAEQVASGTAPVVGTCMTEHADVFFDDSPVFKLGPDAAASGVTTIAWFDSKTPLRSGWAWGQNYLEGGAAMVESSIGKGKLYMFGPEITFRGQPHGTFKLLFNGIYAQNNVTAPVVP